ncbi:hypothetical protein AAZX31_05G086400 [Glycine max]
MWDLGIFPIHPFHAQHLLGLVREPQMVGACCSGGECEVPGYISYTPRIEAADVGLGYFPNNTLKTKIAM